MNPADYLDVDSPAQRGKKSKKRRKVERNTKLSRSLDSLKELHGKNKVVVKRNKINHFFKCPSL